METAYGIAQHIDPNFSRNRTTKELLKFLQEVDAEDIHNATGIYNVSSLSKYMRIWEKYAYTSQQ